jgi:hypothetical protein
MRGALQPEPEPGTQVLVEVPTRRKESLMDRARKEAAKTAVRLKTDLEIVRAASATVTPVKRGSPSPRRSRGSLSPRRSRGASRMDTDAGTPESARTPRNSSRKLYQPYPEDTQT